MGGVLGAVADASSSFVADLALGAPCAVHAQRGLTQGAQDVRAAMLAHRVSVLAPEFVALPVAAVLDVPVLAHELGEALRRGVFHAQAADKIAHGGLTALVFVQVLGACFEDALGKGIAGFLRAYGQHKDAALLDAAVGFLDLALPKKGRIWPGRSLFAAAKLALTCSWSLGWLPFTALT